MNFNKGAKTHGRGTSFKGALTYYLHDKDTLDTAERVSFVEMGNLVTKDPLRRLARDDGDRRGRAAAQGPLPASKPPAGKTNSPSIASRSTGTRTISHPSTICAKPRSIACASWA